MAVEHRLAVTALDQFGDLRRQELLQAGNAFGALARFRQPNRHLVEPLRQTLKLVPGSNLDLMVEIARTDLFGAALQETYRTAHPLRQQIAKSRREQCTGEQQVEGPPQRCTDWREGFG